MLTIKGPVELYITENIKLGESAKIEIDDSVPNSSLTIYLAGKYEGKNSSEINNNTGIPKNFKFYGLDSSALSKKTEVVRCKPWCKNMLPILA